MAHPTYQAWFDTGGSESDPNILVAVGLITTDEKRRRFDASWNAVLARHGVTQLHMFEFAHFKKEFVDWKGDEPRRAAFLADLIATIKRGVNKTYVTGVVLPDFREMNKLYKLSETVGGPYSLGQAGAMFRAFDWLLETRHHQCGVQFFVEKGDTGQGAFMEFLRRERTWQPEILPKIDPTTGLAYPSFQAADFIAYEHRVAYHKRVETGVAPRLRASFASVRRMLPIDVGIADRDMIEKFVLSQHVSAR